MKYCQLIPARRSAAPVALALLALALALVVLTTTPAQAQLNPAEAPKDGWVSGPNESRERQGPFEPIIAFLAPLVVVAGGLGFTLGVCLKATAATDQSRHSLAHRIMIGCAGGVAVGLLYQDIWNLIFGWM